LFRKEQDMDARKVTINLVWDDESATWYTISEDIPGLLLGSISVEVLVERVKEALPEMMELSFDYTGPVELCFEMMRTEYLAVGS
jgi:DNA-binding NarL/FixJ family response regulator